MKKRLTVLLPFVLLIACAPKKQLYTWGKYDDKSYSFLKKKDDKSTQELVEAYKSVIEKQTGTRGTVPPGIYADYGFLLIQLNKTQEGKAMLAKEIALYPESKIFIDRILNRMN